MKANEAPEKIYVHVKGGKVLDTWNNEWIGVHDIEYIRTDAFIEKIYEYLSYHLDTSKIDVSYKFEFIEEFKKYMEGG